ncbi:MAG TPA: hypothetical protein PL105_19785, partial [Caldilineaceae bacterium]|nr:hypothetical protein [Caldilineaceae bacterium]
YIRQSILEPNAVIAPDCWGVPCPAGVMLQSFASSISDSQLDAIVGYLAKLGTADAVALTETAPVEMVMSPPSRCWTPLWPCPKSQPARARLPWANISSSTSGCRATTP